VRDIAGGTAGGRTTVYEYMVRADCAGLGRPLPEGMGDEELEAALFPPLTAELAERRPLPDWRAVHR
jgi:transposase